MNDDKELLFATLAKRFRAIGVEQDDLRDEEWKLFFNRNWTLEVRYVSINSITPYPYATKLVRLLPPKQPPAMPLYDPTA